MYAALVDPPLRLRLLRTFWFRGCFQPRFPASAYPRTSATCTPPSRRWLIPALALGLAPLLAAPAASAPSILVVLTDDMRRDDLAHMPNVGRLLGEQGTSFSSFVANVPLCCPARATLLSGQYSHNTRVRNNGPRGGGFEAAYATGLERATFATALQAAGYGTGYVGKYFNGYPGPAGALYVPPGWDTFLVPVSGGAYDGFGYVLMENSGFSIGGVEVRVPVSYGEARGDYATDVFVAKVAELIEGAVADEKPFVIVLAPFAPHLPAVAAPRHKSLFPELLLPRGPGFAELDVSDKPAYIRRLRPPSERAQLRLDRVYLRRVRSLQAVDEGVAFLIDRLASLGRLDDTYLFLTSDNGFHLGEHRMSFGKETPYEEDIGLPLVVRGPGVQARATVDALAGNTDLAPTLAAIAGAELGYDADGRSLLPWLHGETDVAPWRQAFLLELWKPRGDGPKRAPPYRGLRTRRHLYIEYETGERELYDLALDPAQLENAIATAEPALVARLSERVAALRDCAGAACRAAEDLPLYEGDATDEGDGVE